MQNKKGSYESPVFAICLVPATIGSCDGEKVLTEILQRWITALFCDVAVPLVASREVNGRTTVQD